MPRQKDSIDSSTGVIKRRSPPSVYDNVSTVDPSWRQSVPNGSSFNNNNNNNSSRYSYANNMNNNNNNNNTLDPSVDMIKVVVIGESGAGKSNLIHRLTENRFDSRSKSTIGIDFALFEFVLPPRLNSAAKNVSKQKKFHENKSYRAQIWDTAGQERYRSSMTKIFYRDVAGALLVFDITKREHFHELSRWLAEIRSNVHSIDQSVGSEYGNQIPILLVGNKVDQCERQVEPDEGWRFAKANRLVDYVETSAKDGTNVRYAFMLLFEHIFLAKDAIDQCERDHHRAKVQRESSIKLTPDKHYLAERRKQKKSYDGHRSTKHSNSKCSC